MTLPYIEHIPHRMYFVPILRQRLNFAVLVRRALRELSPWTDRDLIAVSLPPGALSVIRGAVRHTSDVLPISLVMADAGDSDYREVFPITPCDGLIEAVRFAEENGFPLEGVDRDIQPGNLVQRRCLEDPDWPDDALALRWGPDRYLGLIADRLAQPPTRFEPIDTWRESHIADRLRVLQPRYRRILVVCEAVHLASVRRSLRTAGRQYEAAPEPSMSHGLRVMRATADVSLRYLDDFPRLVEMYEVARREGRAADFEKHTELIRALQKSEEDEAPFATRRMRSFHMFLLQLLESSRRVSPRPHEVKLACSGCFGDGPADRFIHYLGGYGKEISFERIGNLSPGADTTYAVVEDDSGSVGRFISRSCNPNKSQYQLKPRSRRWKNSGPLDSMDCGPSEEFKVQMRKKATHLALLAEQNHRVMPFRGSLEGGIDARRTLRSKMSSSPSIYVRQPERRGIHPEVSLEPIVWILDPSLPKVNADRHGLRCARATDREEDAKSNGIDDDDGYTQQSSYKGVPKQLFEADDRSLILFRIPRLGFLSLFDGSLKEAKTASERGNLKLLKHSEMKTDPTIGCVIRELDGEADRGTTWWEILMLTGLKMTKSAMVCVLPDGFRIPERVRTEAALLGKSIVCTRLANFSKLEQARLAQTFSVIVPEDWSKDREAWVDRVDEIKTGLGIAY